MFCVMEEAGKMRHADVKISWSCVNADCPAQKRNMKGKKLIKEGTPSRAPSRVIKKKDLHEKKRPTRNMEGAMQIIT